MENIEIFSSFANAKHDLKRQISTTLIPETTNMILTALKTSQNFYFNKNSEIIGGVAFDEIKERIKLPFPCISILSECFWGDRRPFGKREVMTKFITVAMSSPYTKAFFPDMQNMEKFIIFFSICYEPSQKIWLPEPFLYYFNPEESKNGLILECGSLPETKGLFENVPEEFDPAKEGMTNLNTIANLCVMLSLTNIEMGTEKPPQKINRKRNKKGKPNLKDFHFLKINNKKHKTENKMEAGTPKRAHFRRGHIRKYKNGNMIWVNHCYIKGNASGHVDKMYLVN